MSLLGRPTELEDAWRTRRGIVVLRKGRRSSLHSCSRSVVAYFEYVDARGRLSGAPRAVMSSNVKPCGVFLVMVVFRDVQRQPCSMQTRR